MASNSSKFSIPEDEYVVNRPTYSSKENSSSSTNIIDLSCDDLIVDRENFNIYGIETEESIEQLVADIKSNGFKGAIMAYPVGDKYQIESGHRRYLAAKKAGITKLPVIITETPESDYQRRIRLVSMNLHSRETLKPTVMTNVINTLLQANKEDQISKSGPTDMATLMQIVSNQVELSVKSIEKYRQFDKLDNSLKELADKGVSWSALAQCSSLSIENQINIASIISEKIDRVNVENVSRKWIVSLIERARQETEVNMPVEKSSSPKRRDGGKIIAKAAKEFEDILNGNVIFKDSDRESTLDNLQKIKECIEMKINELS